METSTDDDGDSAATLTKATLIFLTILPAICYKPQVQELISSYLPQQTLSVKKTEPPKPVKKTGQKKKKLYITFDDGPNRVTKNVLHIVKDEQVPVSFFIVGEHVFASAGQTQMWDSLKMCAEIELCNHSFTHAHGHYEKFYKTPSGVVKDFQRTQDSLQLDNAIARTPGRNIWRIDTLRFTDLKKSTEAADSLQKAGFVVIGWDLEWHYDPKTMSVTTTASELVNEVDSLFRHNKTRNADNLVLLAHDQVYAKTEDSLQLRQFLQLLKQKDEYELSVVSSYPGAAPDSSRIK
jgi:peptidoglycan/xylan/chitin deacetylase (PgdA/CDA1 family)